MKSGSWLSGKYHKSKGITGGTATSPKVITITVVIMDILKMKILTRKNCLGGRIGRRWLADAKKWLERRQLRCNTDGQKLSPVVVTGMGRKLVAREPFNGHLGLILMV